MTVFILLPSKFVLKLYFHKIQKYFTNHILEMISTPYYSKLVRKSIVEGIE
ncbi:hypothetical protein [Rummeliibacillus sp. SL167]|uniref:hypothetical protein n=1 Tax=Rummeliibacillus sp. SL167 TaxID=2579792 RepID=UPI001644698D|nr:hypothetical protein [Rummeliibacillus sp. SL167]